MKRRNFLYAVAGLGVYAASLAGLTLEEEAMERWTWMHSFTHFSDDQLARAFEKMKRHGISGVNYMSYSAHKAFYNSHLVPVASDSLARTLKIAARFDIKVFAWMFSLLGNVDRLITDHPDWFVVSREGVSTVDKQPYVGYYRWLCPGKQQVRDYLHNLIDELLSYESLSGIHLDYIRYPDVILPSALQPKYDLKQDRELPEFDFCYCADCRQRFREESGIDPMRLDHPEEDLAWRKFRWNNVTRLVNDIAGQVRSKNRKLSAAVFPTPEIARRLVRQDWTSWDLDLVFPMIYYKYYDESIEWIKTAGSECRAGLRRQIPMYTGLFIPDLPAHQLNRAMNFSRQARASGVCFFSYGRLREKHWQVLAG